MTTVFARGSSQPIAALIRRDLDDRRRLVAGLTLGTFAIAWMIVALYNSVGPAYDDVLDELPPVITSMMGGADFSTPEGFIHVELFSFLGPGLVIAAAISLGASGLAGTEQSGQLALIAAGPLPRSHIVFASIVATLSAVAVVTSGLFAGITFGQTIGRLDVSTTRVLAGCLMAGLLAAAVGTITLAVGAFTGKRPLAIATGTGVAVASYIVDAFFPLSTALEPFAKASLWYPYAHNQPILDGIHWPHALVLATITALASAMAFIGFERRDLACGP